MAVRGFLTVSPALTMALGSSLVSAELDPMKASDPQLRASYIAAVVALLAAPVALRFVAPGYDLVLVAVVGMLQAIGATSLALLSTPTGSEGEFYVTVAARHGLFIAGGGVALVLGAVAARHVARIVSYPHSLLGGALGLTVITVLVGQTVNGARLWLQVGPVRFQPSEVARLLLAAFVAVYLYERRHLVVAPWRVWSLDLPPAPYLLPLIAAVLGAVTVLVLQNDLGMAALVVLGAFAAVVVALQSRALVVAAALLLALAAAGSFAMVPRVRDRVAGWLDPWHDAGGSGFQFVQSDFALASGGLSGQWSTASARAVPELHTDLILTAVGNRLGWLVAIAVIALAAIMTCRCALAALRALTMFDALLALTVAALMAIQVALIAGGTLRVLPLTGLTFPLLSYGGTSMIASLFAIGIVLGIGAASATR